jgi:phosphatidylethanolamine/phosphatidyl-N-methylethanolamine N-methyltransferase
MKHAVAFALGYLRDPRRVGAIAPASRGLASAVAAEACLSATPLIIEAGAGTGAVTGQILRASATGTRVIVYERDSHYARLLRARYPALEIHNQCVSMARRLPLGPGTPLTIVSSLPLLSMPQHERLVCVDTFLQLMGQHRDARLVQYTYAHPWQRPFPVCGGSLHWRRAASIWKNLPPAHVWTLAWLTPPR